MSSVINRIVKSRTFEATVLVLIVLASLVVGLETYPKLAEKYGTYFEWVNAIILAFFAVEIVLKMARHGRHFLRYFRDPWNVFDFAIVAVCLLPLQSGYAAVMRMARIMRALRLMTAVPKLQLIVGALIKSIPSMIYVGLLLALCFYVYAVMGVYLFRSNDPFHFGDLPTAMLSLFRVVTLEDWTDIMYIQMYGSDAYDYTFETAIKPEPLAQPLIGAAYFVSFVMFATMIMLNLFIGVIINSMDEAQAEQNYTAAQRQDKDHRPPTMTEEINAIEEQIDKLKESLQLLRLISEKEASVGRDDDSRVGDTPA